MSNLLKKLKKINIENFNNYEVGEISEKDLENTKFVSEIHPNELDSNTIKGLCLNGTSLVKIAKVIGINHSTLLKYYSDIIYEYRDRGYALVSNKLFDVGMGGDAFTLRYLDEKFERLSKNSNTNELVTTHNKDELLSLLDDKIKKEIKKETAINVISNQDDELLKLLGSLSDEKKNELINILKDKK